MAVFDSRSWSNPYFFFGPRPFREQRVAAYVLREHRRGRPLAEILGDPYLERLGSRTFCWMVLSQPRIIAALGRDAAAAVESCRSELAGSRGEHHPTA